MRRAWQAPLTNPLLLLDVDGVLNALAHDDRGLAAWDDWARGYATADGTSWPITWAPTVVERLLRLHEQGLVELQWLTTWGHDANGELRQLLGLPELRVAGTYEDEGVAGAVTPSAAHASVAPGAPDPLSGRWWKCDVVRRTLQQQPGRQVIWVDDELRRDPFRTWAESQPNLFAIGPAAASGLVAAELDHIETVLERNPDRS